MFNLKDHQTKTADFEEENGYHSPETGSTEVIDPESGVKRGLKNRHLSMMALAGIIGPGLLVGAGGALQNGGPASLLIGFGVIGIIAFSIMQSLGEITTLYPGGGSFISLAERMVDKGFSVAVGWVSVSHNPEQQITPVLTWIRTTSSFGLLSSRTSITSSRASSFSGATRYLFGVTS